MKCFKEIPKSEWPSQQKNLTRVFINKDFLVQEFDEGTVTRLSICCTKRKGSKWADGITWDQLNSIKSAIGFAKEFAVECYPEEKNIVNVANMRHLWIMKERLPFAWLRQ
tara:strand:+ start:15932 stop:16261 length:330 start_codon:yes stop_codon:yes gene_type:complete